VRGVYSPAIVDIRVKAMLDWYADGVVNDDLSGISGEHCGCEAGAVYESDEGRDYVGGVLG